MAIKQKAPRGKPRSGATANKAKRARSASGSSPHDPNSTGKTHHQLIETAAYFRAERRGFEPGHELEDWLAAEAEVERLSKARDASVTRRAERQ